MNDGKTNVMYVGDVSVFERRTLSGKKHLLHQHLVTLSPQVHEKKKNGATGSQVLCNSRHGAPTRGTHNIDNTFIRASPHIYVVPVRS